MSACNISRLSRSSGTLSGGESQRIRLASQIGSGLTGVLYVLDEPSSACTSATMTGCSKR
jgi:excinuclease UvrABC ATPase subunit